MDREQRIRRWLDEPDCPREMAEAIVTLEDAEDEIRRLQGLLYSEESLRILQMIERGARKLCEAVEAETGVVTST